MGLPDDRHTIREIVYTLKELLNSRCKIRFNNQVNEGNPIYYWADIEKLNKIGKSNNVTLNKGLREYVTWFKKLAND